MYQILKGFQIVSVHFLFSASVPKKMSFQNSDHYSKRRFTPAEDQIIQSLAKIEGSNDWNIIAQSVKTKSARQCRDRWNNYLNPNLNNTEWTKEDDDLLLQKFLKQGPKWKTFSLIFKGRSLNNVRNRCLKLIRRSKSKKNYLCQQNKASSNDESDEEDIVKHQFVDTSIVDQLMRNLEDEINPKNLFSNYCFELDEYFGVNKTLKFYNYY